jgi:hypothetical protein
MPITINGTTGIAGVDGSASTPSLQGADTNTGMFFPAADTIAFAEGGAEVMRIDSSGNVGIGTSSPAYRLDTAGVTRSQVQSGATNNTAPTAFVVANKTTGAHAAGLGASIQFEYTNSGGAYSGGQISSVGGADPFTADLRFFPRNYGFAEAMRIDSSGNVMIGATSASSKFLVTSSNDNIVSTISGNSGAAYISNRTSASGGSLFVLYITYNGNAVGSITNTSSATAYNTGSDYRLKENIVPMTGALDKVSQLKPVTFKWKVDGSDGQGFIAHELQEVIPDAVTGEKDAVNEDGSIKPQGVDTSFLVATLTAAIQEQQTIIESLKTDIAELKAKVGK